MDVKLENHLDSQNTIVYLMTNGFMQRQKGLNMNDSHFAINSKLDIENRFLEKRAAEWMT